MFGEWLRRRRDGLGLTRKELAKRVGCSVAMLRKIESGERRPSGQIAQLMANALDIPPAEHSTFVGVARGDLNVERLKPPSNLIPLPNISTPRTNLPVLPTPLVGRQRELEKICSLLGDPQCRLLTLVGPGGIGKTRLAIEAASRMQEAFADGVYFIPLAPVSSIRYVVPVIADAIGFAFQSASAADPRTQLFNFLKEKNILFLADNCEHLLTEPGIDMLAELLASAPQIHLLATSRELLGLQGEWTFEVHGLPVPEDYHAEGTSIELFIQRARRAHVGFNAIPEDLPAILRVCRLVEGMPLAIELAAPWVRTLTCGEIAKEIERGLDVLSVSTRHSPARHRSMRAVFDHSWKLLTEEEGQVLARLSVFRGGFQREAAAQVAGASLSVLSALITKSLIRRTGDHRYDLHELVRQYAAEQLADQARARKEAQKRHALYYLQYFTTRGTPLQSFAQQETLAELSAEMDNFRTAWDWAIAHHEFRRVHQAASELWYLFELRTWFEEGELVFRKAAETIEAYAAHIGSDPEAPAMANDMRVYAAYFTFRRGNTLAAYDEMTLARSRFPERAAIYAHLYLGFVARDLGKSAEASDAFQESLEEAEASGDQWLQSMTGQLLGIIALETGEYELAHRHLMNALALAHEIGDPTLIAHALGFLSMTLQTMGETAEAERFLQESLALTRKVGYRWGVGNALDGLGVLAQNSNPHEARRLFSASSDVYREIGDLRSLTRALCHQGHNSLALDDVPDARNSFTEALRLARQCDYTPYALEALAGFASMFSKQDNRDRALQLLLVVLDHPAILSTTKERAAHLLAELEGQLTPQQVEAVQARMQANSFEAAARKVLEEAEPG